jgi:ubiquinone/menaquinone biosynthesis C-methylase UbiE
VGAADLPHDHPSLISPSVPHVITGDRYARAARGWATGAARVYGPLAHDLVAAAPHPLAGRRVLDAGAGTGLASGALAAVGARPLAVDLSLDMLAWDAARRPPSVAGAVDALPLADAVVDDVVAAFVLNHVSDPGDALAELIRVTRSGGALLASVYATTNHSAARDRIDDVVRAHGWTAPAWYAHLKSAQAPLLGDAPAMAAAAHAAGLVDVDVREDDTDIGLDRAPDLVDYRLGQAHVAAWLGEQDDRARETLRAAAIAAVAPVMAPYRPRVVRLVARVR